VEASYTARLPEAVVGEVAFRIPRIVAGYGGGGGVPSPLSASLPFPFILNLFVPAGVSVKAQVVVPSELVRVALPDPAPVDESVKLEFN
jgi:hypothetical protein